MKLLNSGFKTAVGLASAMALCFAAATSTALAQGYPSKPVRIISPYAAGGGNDAIARAVGLALSKKLGQPVVIENKAGANGVIGADFVAKQPPDGYAIVLVPTQHVYNSSIYEKLPFDPLKDFTPITLVGSAPLLIVASKTAPFKNLPEFIKYAKSRPANEINFSTAGAGSAGHLAGAMLAQVLGLKFQHVAYRGAAPASQALFTGEVMVSISPPPPLLPLVRQDRVNAIGMTGRNRSQSAPDIPTIVEQGVDKYDAGLWYGFLGPAKMPRDIVMKLNAAINEVINEKELKQTLAQNGLDVTGSTPEEFGKLMASDAVRWAPIIKSTGLKPE